MKETKFKAWHKAEKVMCDVSTINFDSGAFLVGVKKGEDQIEDKYFIPAPIDGRFCNFDEFELLQYTGLKDKNGKEIYEGSIVRVDAISIYEAKNAIMKWRDWESENYWMKIKAGWYLSGINRRIAQIWTEKTIEIIGNIHKNPELLKS